MTDKEVFEEVKKRVTDPYVLDLLRAGLADPKEMEDIKRAVRYGDDAMNNPKMRDSIYKTFSRLLNVVKSDSTTRQIVKHDLRQLQKQSGDSDMSENLDTANVEKAVQHDCAKHVVHETWGKGECIPGEHTLLDDGTVTHYDVMFEHGVEQNVSVADLTILVEMNHGHSRKKKAMEEEAVTPAGGNDTSKASKKGKLEMPLERLKAIMEKKKSEAYKAMLRSQGKMEEEVDEKMLTKAEMKKREEVAKAIKRDNPEMPMGKKMAIATATAKKVAEELVGNQHKIDANKNGKIDAHDFKLLQAKKKTMKEFVEELAESLRLVEASNDKTYSMDIDHEDGDPKGDKALHNAHKHFVKMGYKISHESGDDSISKKVKQPDMTYHYGRGDDTHHAFTIHKGGKAASDPHIKHLTKHLTDTSESLISEEEKYDIFKHYPKSNHLHMSTHEGDERHVIKGVAHNLENADKVADKVHIAGAKLAKLSLHDHEEAQGMMDGPHHSLESHPHPFKPDMVHNSIADYVKHHAPRDAKDSRAYHDNIS